ncbi:hypothetical protein NMG60_11022530 [Bertholletia excelsa]
MKKLYRKGAVHPSPPPISDQLAFLPAAILTLAAALSPEDREVLAYLISCSSGNLSGNRKATRKTQVGTGVGKVPDHTPSFNCDCFGCYTSYWARWDSSVNRQVIHEIIDALEDGLLVQSNKREKGKREKRRRGPRGSDSDGLTRPEVSSNNEFGGESEAADEAEGCSAATAGVEEGSVRKLVGFLGEKFWGVWT